MDARTTVRICVAREADAKLLAVLRALPEQANGERYPFTFEFLNAFPDKASADAFAADAELEGFSVSVEPRQQRGARWRAVASKNLVPIDSEIADVEKELQTLAIPHGGRSVRWDRWLLTHCAGRE